MCRRSLRSQSKPGEEEKSSEVKNRRKQRELMVAAAKKHIIAAATAPACTTKAEKMSSDPNVGVNKCGFDEPREEKCELGERVVHGRGSTAVLDDSLP